MHVIAITGLPGAGKSTIAAMLKEAGAEVFDADAEVRRLYGPGGAAVPALAERFPEVVENGAVNSARLKELLLKEPAALALVEGIVHPLVAAARRAFLRKAQAAGARMAVLDIPLLYESGAHEEADLVVLADAPDEVRLTRLEQRPGFDQALLRLLEARQLPLAQKRARADVIIDTSGSFEDTRRQVTALLRRLDR